MFAVHAVHIVASKAGCSVGNDYSGTVEAQSQEAVRPDIRLGDEVCPACENRCELQKSPQKQSR